MKAAALLLVLASCHHDVKKVEPEENTMPESAPAPVELTIAQRWSGPIKVDAEPPAGVAVRDADAYAALIARLPEFRLQMKQPAPANDDPLRAAPAIDFTRDMLVVIARGDTLTPPTLARVVSDGTGARVWYVAPTPPPEARPRGYGGYSAALVPRVDGDVEFSPPLVIEDAAQAKGAAGALVTLRGELTRTKIPTILGIDVEEGSAEAGTVAEATGWLECDTVTQAEIDERVAKSGQFANRGAGTFCRLVAVEGGGLAQAYAP